MAIDIPPRHRLLGRDDRAGEVGGMVVVTVLVAIADVALLAFALYKGWKELRD